MKGKESPEELIKQGFSLKPKCPKDIPNKNRIIEQRFGTDGKLYGRIQRMNKIEQKCFDNYEKEHKEGKGVYFQYEPLGLMMKFKYDLDVKKDKKGNITIKISERMK